MACPDPYRAHTRRRIELISEQFKRPTLPDPELAFLSRIAAVRAVASAIKGWQQ